MRTARVERRWRESNDDDDESNGDDDESNDDDDESNGDDDESRDAQDGEVVSCQARSPNDDAR